MNSGTNGTNTTTLQRTAAVIALLAAVFALYYRTLDNPFVWDDQFLILKNYFIHNLKNIGGLFTQAYFTQPVEISYRPVATLTYMIDYALWRTQPQGWHFFNVTLHFLNSLLVYALAARAARRAWLALGLALLFALHPVNTEAINAVTFREDPLCLFFMLASLLIYIGYSEGRARGALRLAASIVLYAVSYTHLTLPTIYSV